MKINFNHLLVQIFLMIWIFVSVFWLYSCDTAKRAQRHLLKAQRLGVVCGEVDTLKVIDSIPYTVNDTIVWRYYYKDSLIIVNDRFIPKTRYEIRTEYKIHRDTIRVKETEIKYQLKEQKSEDRKQYIWVALGLILLIAIYLIKKK